MNNITGLAALSLAIFLTGCAADGSLVKNVSHPTRKDFVINGIKIAVVQYPKIWVAWFASDKLYETIPPLPLVKLAQIAAIEEYSNCKVVGAEFDPGSLQPAYLEAIVKCE
jgi:hypothetical protein